MPARVLDRRARTQLGGRAHAARRRRRLRPSRAQRDERASARSRSGRTASRCDAALTRKPGCARLASARRALPTYDRDRIEQRRRALRTRRIPSRPSGVVSSRSLLAADPRWGICEVSLRSTDVRDALAPQDRLYTLAVCDEAIVVPASSARSRRCWSRPKRRSAVLQRLADPQVRTRHARRSPRKATASPPTALSTLRIRNRARPAESRRAAER